MGARDGAARAGLVDRRRGPLCGEKMIDRIISNLPYIMYQIGATGIMLILLGFGLLIFAGSLWIIDGVIKEMHND